MHNPQTCRKVGISLPNPQSRATPKPAVKRAKAVPDLQTAPPYRSGMQAHIPKPVDINVLTAKLSEVLSRQDRKEDNDGK